MGDDEQLDPQQFKVNGNRFHRPKEEASVSDTNNAARNRPRNIRQDSRRQHHQQFVSARACMSVASLATAHRPSMR